MKNASRRSFFAGTQLPQDAILMTDATVPIDIVSVPAPAPTLRRELGRWNLTAIGVNQVIGSAVFILPSQVAAQLGNWSPIAFLLAGFASLLVALCFAEVGSRFDGTGGAYLYARAAFGRFVGFEVGWLQWISGATLQAAVANAIALALGFYWPVMTGGVGRASIITAVTLTVAWINVRGIRQSAIVIQLVHHRKASSARVRRQADQAPTELALGAEGYFVTGFLWVVTRKRRLGFSAQPAHRLIHATLAIRGMK